MLKRCHQLSWPSSAFFSLSFPDCIRSSFFFYSKYTTIVQCWPRIMNNCGCTKPLLFHIIHSCTLLLTSWRRSHSHTHRDAMVGGQWPLFVPFFPQFVDWKIFFCTLVDSKIDDLEHRDSDNNKIIWSDRSIIIISIRRHKKPNHDMAVDSESITICQWVSKLNEFNQSRLTVADAAKNAFVEIGIWFSTINKYSLKISCTYTHKFVECWPIDSTVSHTKMAID